jgi:hypothetical protein
VQKLRAKEIEEREKEVERDRWFNQDWPMMGPGKTWKEKQIDREEKGRGLESDDDSYSEEGGGGAQNVEINMVFELSREFGLPEPVAAQLTLGVERAIFEKTQHTRAAYETIVYQRSLGRHAS